MPTPSDFLPEPPWEGPPVPKLVAKRARRSLCFNMIKMLRAQQRKDLIIEEFAHFNNDQLEDIIKYILKEMEGL